MANGTDAEDCLVLSKVRTGLKREFEFAMKVQSEICGSLGRTRSRRTYGEVLNNGAGENSRSKRRKSGGSKEVTNEAVEEEDKRSGFEKKLNDSVDGMSEEEAKSDVVDVVDVEDGKSERGAFVLSVCGKVKKSEEERKEPKMVVMNGEMDVPETKLLSENDQRRGLVNGDENSEALADKCGEELKKDDRIVQTEEGLSGVVPISTDGHSKLQNVLNEERPFRRFTRSALKPKVEPIKNAETKKSSSVRNDVDGNDEAVVTSGDQDMNTPKKATRKFPAKLKDLLESGILEGLPVKYLRGSRSTRARGLGETELKGVIRGSGILCFCSTCKGNKLVTPTTYELHAGSSNKRPLEYIYLENGKTFRDVMNACLDSPLAMLEEAVQLAVGGSSIKRSSFCLNCRGSMPAAGTGKSMLLCDSCLELKQSEARLPQTTYTSDGLSNSIIKSSDSPLSGSSLRIKSQGRLTRKDLRLHKLVFEEDVLPDGTEVSYFARGQKLLVGYKKGFGILCSCCNSEVSPSQFEAHAGWATRRKPFHNIYTSNGVSLHELAISLCKDEKFSTLENDELCSICHDGGDLLCCDTCPRAYHTECVSLPSIPTGKWSCKFCQNTFLKENFVSHNANAKAAGRVEGVDPIEQITKRLIRIVTTPDVQVGGCALCRGHGFSRSGFGPRTVMICDQCEREFHVGCLKEHNMADLKELPPGKWFCCMACDTIHAALEKLINYGENKLPDSSLDAIMKKHVEKSWEGATNVDIKWRVLSWKIKSDDLSRELLSKAVGIFHDRFAPISGSSSAKVRDLIPSMVYGRKTKEQDFGGMYCALLTVNQAVVSAGIFRIFGQVFAEIPLVATLTEWQGQGYFQSLFDCIEKLLGSLNVKTIVLPAADEAESIWTNKFGFNQMTQDEVNKFKRDYPLMVFQGTSMLHKSIPECQTSEFS